MMVVDYRSGERVIPGTVYVELENLSKSNPPYKSVAALNCIVLGCANVWDLDRAYETFEAITEKIGLTPDIHSYNSLMCAFGKVKKVDAGFTPSKEMLKKVRRRCSRELDFTSDERVQSLAQLFRYPMGSEARRELLYRIQYGANY
ncbi:Pentatricopeptide repeat-containing protein [Platanthera guangdongensis]|uniref:Pentatricopeptide repeat-containing protein n=1 Tax=Platanthera guangdongensis TaxID=2320717 RepID=A0ABR2LD42_9ASPA